MPLPFAATAAFGAAGLFHGVVSQPIEASLRPRGIALAQRAMYKDPLILPDVGVVIDLLNRQMIDSDLANGLLRNHGVTLWGMEGDEHDGEYYRSASAAWRKVKDLSREIPSVSHYLDLYIRGLMDPVPASRNIIRAGGNPDYWFKIADRMRTRPGVGEVIDAWMRGRLEPPDFDRLMKEAGSDSALWQPVLAARRALPGVGDLLQLRNRGLLTDQELNDYLIYSGFQGGYEREKMTQLRFALPGIADLTIMGIREAFRPELGSLYDYYSEFPELTRPWFQKLGFDYPVGFEIPTQTGPRQATMADMAWAAHWHPMPLGMAYQAYQRFRPDRIGLYNAEVPNLKPFELNDLRLHMRLADLPPGVRDWMIALSHQPLSRMDIRRSIRYSGKDFAWAVDAYLDLGVKQVDAEVLARNAVEQEIERDHAWLTAIERQADRQTVKEIQELYKDGIVNRAFAADQLGRAGVSERSTEQMLDLVDYGVKRSLIKQAVSATGRDYLSGELDDAGALTQLSRLGVLDFRAADYLAAWRIRKDRRRKQLETGKIATMVVEGLLSPADARARLSRLGWDDPDAALLMAEAAQKVSVREQKAAASADRSAKAKARELERLAKAAEAQAKALRSELSRVAPRSVLTKWLKDGVITESQYHDMLKDRGYDEDDIRRYIADSKVQKPGAKSKPPKPPKPPAAPKPKEPTLAMLTHWFLDTLIDEPTFRSYLGEMGYEPSEIDNIVAESEIKHGAKGKTVSPPSPPEGG